MSDTKTEKTVAAELREAAARAREHLLPAVTARVLKRDTAILAICGNHDEAAEICRNCHYLDVRDRVLARLMAMLINAREPLASWLEKTAQDVAKAVYQDEICSIPGGSQGHCEADCPGHDPVLVCDECGNLLAPTGPKQGDRCRCWDTALATARVINGTAS